MNSTTDYITVITGLAKTLIFFSRLKDVAAKRISFQFQCVTWKLEKALSNLPYDLYDISDEVREQVTLYSSKDMILLVFLECFKVVSLFRVGGASEIAAEKSDAEIRFTEL